MNHRPYQKASIVNLPASIFTELSDIATLLQTEPREVPVDATEARPAATPAPMRIRRIDIAALDLLLAPLMGYGMLRTAYHAATGATVYSSPLRSVIAMSIGSDHFANADTGLFTALKHKRNEFHMGMDEYGDAAASALAQLVASMPTPVRATDPKAWDDVPPAAVSPALYMQMFGRGKRIPQPVQWVLENPMTGEILERGQFPGGDE